MENETKSIYQLLTGEMMKTAHKKALQKCGELLEMLDEEGAKSPTNKPAQIAGRKVWHALELLKSAGELLKDVINNIK
jgi:hypothetical protein